MRLAGTLVPTLGDDAPAGGEHAADAWIRIGREQAARGERERAAHALLVEVIEERGVHRPFFPGGVSPGSSGSWLRSASCRRR